MDKDWQRHLLNNKWHIRYIGTFTISVTSIYEQKGMNISALEEFAETAESSDVDINVTKQTRQIVLGVYTKSAAQKSRLTLQTQLVKFVEFVWTAKMIS